MISFFKTVVSAKSEDLLHGDGKSNSLFGRVECCWPGGLYRLLNPNLPRNWATQHQGFLYFVMVVSATRLALTAINSQFWQGIAMAVNSAGLNRKSKIFIVDDHPLVREGLKARIESEPDLVVCGEAADAPEALRNLKEALPHLVIVDLALKSSYGLDLIKEIKSRFSQMKTLVVSAYDEVLYAERALRAGAQGYVNKQEVQDTIIEAIRSVLDGRRYLSQQMTQRLLTNAIDGKDENASEDPLVCLSDRELQVFQLIGQGKSTSAIAKHLHLSVHTIDSHRENIRHKFKLANGSELMQRAVKWVLENG